MPFDGKQMEVRLDALENIDRVIGLLDTPDKWCQGMLKTRDGRFCILGAIAGARADSALVPPLLIAIKQVTGRSYHRVETFNDHRRTTHAVVVQVLQRARDNILAGQEQAVPLRQRESGLWNRFGALFAAPLSS